MNTELLIDWLFLDWMEGAPSRQHRSKFHLANANTWVRNPDFSFSINETVPDFNHRKRQTSQWRGPAILKHERNINLHKDMDPVCKCPSCGHAITSQGRDARRGPRLGSAGLQDDHPGQDGGGGACRKGRGAQAPQLPAPCLLCDPSTVTAPTLGTQHGWPSRVRKEQLEAKTFPPF